LVLVIIWHLPCGLNEDGHYGMDCRNPGVPRNVRSLPFMASGARLRDDGLTFNSDKELSVVKYSSYLTTVGIRANYTLFCCLGQEIIWNVPQEFFATNQQ
jgi:hypothetical protein